MGGGGFMKHASDTNRKDRAQRASRRKKFNGNHSAKSVLDNNKSTKLSFDNLTDEQITKERTRLKSVFKSDAKRKRRILIISSIITLFILYVGLSFKSINSNPFYSVGQPIDSFNNVTVYYNGGVNNVEKRRVVNGYNLGLEFQCVEFVKRYYFEFLNHKMPETYGHAIDFFDPYVSDGEFNIQRGLTQYTNSSHTKPAINDIVIMDKTIFNPYGHVAIISNLNDSIVEIIQQNPGPFQPSRLTFGLSKTQNKWHINEKRIIGWLRK